jgi:Ca2+-binding RTX toxin-like protein
MASPTDNWAFTSKTPPPVPDAIPPTTGIVGTNDDDILLGEVGDNLIQGLAGNDRLVGRDGNDLLQGGDGNDDLLGRYGNDTLEGGNGRDTLDGGAGKDRLQGGAGIDIVYGREDNDTIEGGEGLDLLWGEAGDDTVYADGEIGLAQAVAGQNGAATNAKGDWMDGDEGDDILATASSLDLLGTSGNDTLQGGDGADAYWVTPGMGQDRLVETSGSNTLQIARGPSRSTLTDTRTGNDLLLMFKDGSGSVTLADYYAGGQDWRVVAGKVSLGGTPSNEAGRKTA